MPVVKCWSLQSTFLSFKLLGGKLSFVFILSSFGYVLHRRAWWKRWRDIPGLEIYIYPCWRDLPKHLITLYMPPRDQRCDSTQVHLSESMRDYLEEHGWLTYRQLCLQKACTTHQSCMIETPTPVHIPFPMYLSIAIYGLYIHPLYIRPRTTACSHEGLQAAGGGMYWNAEVVVILREGRMTTPPPPCAKNWCE